MPLTKAALVDIRSIKEVAFKASCNHPTRTTNKCTNNYRPGVAGAVLQTPL